MKRCDKCHETKPFDQFAKSANKNSKYDNACRSCRNAKRIERMNAKPELRERHRQRAKRYRDSGQAKPYIQKKGIWIDGVGYRQCLSCFELKTRAEFVDRGHCTECKARIEYERWQKQEFKKSIRKVRQRKCAECQRPTEKYVTYCEECKAWNNKNNLLRKYNITIFDYNEMLAEQDCRCKVCHTQSYTLAVDHDHSCCPGAESCGKCIRGLLCKKCNAGLGQFNDDPVLLLAAAKYLQS